MVEQAPSKRKVQQLVCNLKSHAVWVARVKRVTPRQTKRKNNFHDESEPWGFGWEAVYGKRRM